MPFIKEKNGSTFSQLVSVRLRRRGEGGGGGGDPPLRDFPNWEISNIYTKSIFSKTVVHLRYIGNISGPAMNISTIDGDWLHLLGTRSAEDFSKVPRT